MLTEHEKIELGRLRRRLKGDDLRHREYGFYNPAPTHLRRILEVRIKELEAKEKGHGHTDTG
jgi:hypothetical protein